jgi:nucleoside-diphosphate-sugar epimerase
MNITIIGGSGFIGTELLSLLDKSAGRVVNLDKSMSSAFPDLTVVTDVTDADEVERKLDVCEWVILLAAEHRDDVSPIEKYYKVNVDGAANVVKAMDRKGIRKIIFTSSVAVFGLDKDNPDEDHPKDTINHYCKSKWEAEEVLRKWYKNDPEDKTLVIIRPTVVFGRGNRGNVYNLLSQIASGRFLMIGNGENRKSMAYVKNVTSFIKHCMEKQLKGYHVFNYADKPDLSMNELVNISEKQLNRKVPQVRIPYFVGYLAGKVFDVAAALTGKKLPVSSVRIKKFCATTQFSSKYIAQTGFVAPYSLDKALSDTIQSIIDANKK